MQKNEKNASYPPCCAQRVDLNNGRVDLEGSPTLCGGKSFISHLSNKKNGIAYQPQILDFFFKKELMVVYRPEGNPCHYHEAQ